MTREETIYELGEWLEQMIQHGVPSHSAKRKALATAIALLSADRPSVVRCGDCKWWQNDYMGTWCSRFNDFQKDEDFCSWGERKGGDAE